MNASLLKMQTLLKESHKALFEFLNNGGEISKDETLAWITIWKLREKATPFLVKHLCVFKALKEIRAQKLPILTTEQALTVFEDAERYGAKILTPRHKEYPLQLKSIVNFPLALHAFGNIGLLQRKMFAIVGSRSASADAMQIAQKFAVDVSKNGMTIVSGFANGVDTAACIGAMPFGTVQVLGSGFGCLYPKNNSDLFKRVIENKGLFLSEFPINTPAMPDHFPTRNRIITGLSSGVLIGQVNRKGGVSGTLVTLRIALSQGKEIFACPGNILDERSKISNDLIKNGTAHFTTCVDDILNVLGQASENKIQAKQGNLFASLVQNIAGIEKIEESMPEAVSFKEEDFETIHNILSTTPISVSEIVSISRLQTARVQEVLSELELDGMVEMNSAGRYTRV